jgi:hypothetical protein
MTTRCFSSLFLGKLFLMCWLPAGINWSDAYGHLKGQATISGRTPYYRQDDHGWVSVNTIPKMSNAASKSLKFAYLDFCVSTVAGGSFSKHFYDGNSWTGCVSDQWSTVQEGDHLT